MPLELPEQIKIINPAASVDLLYGPYNSIAEALAATDGLRAIGKTVAVIEAGEAVEYWFRDGLLDNQLIIKAASIESAEDIPDFVTSVLAAVLVNNTNGNEENKAASVLALKTYVSTKLAELIDSSPGTLDTLNELAAALGDDPNFATTITNLIANVQANVGLKLNKALAEGFTLLGNALGQATPTPTEKLYKENDGDQEYTKIWLEANEAGYELGQKRESDLQVAEKTLSGWIVTDKVI